MLTVQGQLLQVADDSYTKRQTGEVIAQSVVLVLPEGNAKDVYKITIPNKFIPHLQNYRDAIGKRVAIPVEIFAFQNGGYKLNTVAEAPRVFPAKPDQVAAK